MRVRTTSTEWARVSTSTTVQSGEKPTLNGTPSSGRKFAIWACGRLGMVYRAANALNHLQLQSVQCPKTLPTGDTGVTGDGSTMTLICRARGGIVVLRGP